MQNRFSLSGFTDRRATLVLLLAYALLLVSTWQRWTQPLIDHGREMHLPARLVAGETLYRDVQFLYGPFAPYFNALLYRVFGIHLGVLQTTGALVGTCILFLLYWLARRLMKVPQAFATALLVLVICVLKGTGSYIQPYAFAALYGLALALASLAATVRFVQTHLTRWCALAGLGAGLAVINKPEIALAALASGGMAWLLVNWQTRRVHWRAALAFIAPVITITALAYGFILARVSWHTLTVDNHVLFSAMPPSLIFFNRSISGLAYWPQSLWFTASGLAMFAVWWGGSVVVGATLARNFKLAVQRGLPWLSGGLAALALAFNILKVESNVTPFASAVLLLPCVVAACLWNLRNLRKREEPAPHLNLLLLYSVFSLCGILRGFLKIRISGPYAPFFIPLLIVVYLYLLLEIMPRWQITDGFTRRRVQGVTLTLLVLMAVGTGFNSVKFLRRTKTVAVQTERGRMVVEPEFGAPMTQAVSYIKTHTQPDEPVLCLPQATTLNFMAARRYPFFPEILHPGFLTGSDEQAAIARLERARVPLILIVNFDTSEFYQRAFGIDYNQPLMAWINEHYRVAARFDTPASQSAQLGGAPFFIVAYERNMK